MSHLLELHSCRIKLHRICHVILTFQCEMFWDILLKQMHLLSPINRYRHSKTLRLFRKGLERFALFFLEPPPHRTSQQALPSLITVLDQHTKRSQHETA